MRQNSSAVPKLDVMLLRVWRDDFFKHKAGLLQKNL